MSPSGYGLHLSGRVALTEDDLKTLRTLALYLQFHHATSHPVDVSLSQDAATVLAAVNRNLDCALIPVQRFDLEEFVALTRITGTVQSVLASGSFGAQQVAQTLWEMDQLPPSRVELIAKRLDHLTGLVVGTGALRRG